MSRHKTEIRASRVGPRLQPKELRKIEDSTKSFASKNGVVLSPEFRSSLNKYFRLTLKQLPKIEISLNSRVTRKEVAWALTTIGRASVHASRARKNRVVTGTDLQDALSFSKKLGGEILDEKMLRMGCDLPNCWSAVASLIYKGRDFASIKDSKLRGKNTSRRGK